MGSHPVPSVATLTPNPAETLETQIASHIWVTGRILYPYSKVLGGRNINSASCESRTSQVGSEP